MPSTPGIVNYPTSLDDVISLVEVVNNVSTTLSLPLNGPDTVINVVNSGLFTESGIVTVVDNPSNPTQIEIINYTSKSSSALNVPSIGGRGAQGTTAQGFATGATVVQRPTARHHTVLADAIRALEAKLGIGLDTPGGGAEALLSDAIGQAIWRAIQKSDVTGLVSDISNINAALAQRVRKDDTALQSIISDLLISKGAPQIKLTHTGLSKTWILIVNGSGQLVIGEDGISNAITIDPVTGLVMFEEIPVLPAANPTSVNQAVRKGYIDGLKTAWSISFYIEDPTVYPIQAFRIPEWICPPGVNITVTHVQVTYNSGSNTGDAIFEVRKRTGGGQTPMAAFQINTINVFGLNTFDISDIGITSGESIYIIQTATANPQQRGITIAVQGVQNFTT